MRQYGFINKNERSEIPLEKIQVRSFVKGFTAEVVATMEYKNNSDNPIEAIYVFPLDEEAAVCGFQATIDGRTIIAEVQEKQEARDTYDDAISSGHSAFLLEESDESSDIFQINVGNLPPRESATVELKFVTTLRVEKEGRVVFVLPTVLNPRYTPSDCKASASTTMQSIASVTNKYSFDFEMNVQCTSPIQEITSPCNQLSVEIKPDDSRQATVRLNKDSYKFDADVQVQVLCSKPFEPNALVERNGATNDEFLSKSVIMVNFFPEFDSSADLERGEFIFVVDRSGSMDGAYIKSARDTLLLFMKSLPEDCYFNIVGFGSSFRKLFKKSEPYNDNTLKTACSHCETMQADLGGTEILPPLKDVFEQPLIKNSPRQVFLLTDGAVGNTQQVIDLVKGNSSKARCFAFGIGSGASTALVKGVARAGKGVAEFVASGENMQAKVIKVLKNALQPALLDCQVAWDLPQGCSVETIPQVPQAIFSGNSLIIYGLVPSDSTIKGSVTISGTLAVGSTAENIQHKFSLDNVAYVDNSFLLHRLAAKTFIQEKQDSNDEDANIEKMSKSANVVSKLTSFVAVDKENKKPVSGSLNLPNHLDSDSDDEIPITSGFDSDDEMYDDDVGYAAYRREQSLEIDEGCFERCRFKRACLRFAAPQHTDEDRYDDELYDDVIECASIVTPKLHTNASHQKGCLKIVSLQNASGAWQLTDELATICETQLDKFRQTCPFQVTTKDKDNLWATALALACLTEKFPGQKDEWEMVAAKGTKWLKKHLPKNGFSYEKIMEIATKVLGL